MRRIVINLLGLQGTDDADVIGKASDVRERRTHLLSRFAILLEFMRRTEAFELLILELRDGLPFGERLRHRFPVHLRQLGFVIQRFQMRGATCHAEVDNPFCLRRHMRLRDDAGPPFNLRRGFE